MSDRVKVSIMPDHSPFARPGYKGKPPGSLRRVIASYPLRKPASKTERNRSDKVDWPNSDFRSDPKESLMSDYEIFELGDVVLQSKATLRGAKLAYKTFGTLNASKDNAIVYPTWYSAQHMDNEWLIGEGMALDPRRYFIIIPNMLGNGLSSSPSNTPEPYDKARFPRVTVHDQVQLQHRLVTERFGIERVALVVG